jgi:hypothetical protein
VRREAGKEADVIKQERTQINIKLTKELKKRLRRFMADHECDFYWQAIQLLLDIAEKKCVRVKRCVCVEATMEEL